MTMTETERAESPPRGPTRRVAIHARKHFAGARARTRELGWVMAGRLVMTGANSVLMLALSVWLMDVATFGTMAIAIGAQLLLSRVVLFGADQAVIRLFTLAEDGPSRGEAAVRHGLSATLLLCAPLGLGAALLAALGLANVHPLLAPVVVLSIAAGAGGSALFDLAYAEHLARLRYARAATLQMAMPTTRLLVTVAAARLAGPGGQLPFLAYALTPLAFGLFQAARIARRTGLGLARRPILELLRYSLPVGLADLAMILALNQGVFLLGALGQRTEAGILAFAQTFGLGLFAVYVAFYQTILPRAARIGELANLRRFLARVYTMAAALLVAGGLLVAVIAAYGPEIVVRLKPDEPELARFGAPFVHYAAFTLLLVAEAPLAVTCHYLLRPAVQLLAMGVRCAAIGALGLALAPTQGALGAARAQILGSLVSFVVLALSVAILVRRRKEASACAGS